MNILQLFFKLKFFIKNKIDFPWHIFRPLKKLFVENYFKLINKRKEKEEFNISFCTTCMNRTKFLKKTLKKNLDDLELDSSEIVLLDYNSTDGLETWIKKNFQKYIKKGKLKYCKTKKPTKFNRSHAKNVAHKLASNKIVCNLDADNFIGKGFDKYLANLFSKYKNITLRAYGFGACGRIALEKKLFEELKGYDESFVGWGAEDDDLLLRAKQKGYFVSEIKNKNFTKFLDNKVKNENEKGSKNIKESENKNRELLLQNLNGRKVNPKGFGKEQVTINFIKKIDLK